MAVGNCPSSGRIADGFSAVEVFKHQATYFLMGAGVASLLFALGRTYFLVHRAKKERDSSRSRGDFPPVPPQKHHEE